MNRYRIRKIDAPLGVELFDLDVNDIDRQTAALLREDLAKHLVLILRNTYISSNAHFNLAQCFGTPEVHEFVSGINGIDQVTEIRKEPEHIHNFGGHWHFDLSFRKIPPVCAVLVARDLPHTGGDTLWSNQYLAYESLAEPLRERISGLKAVHTSRLAFGGFANGDKAISSVHPLAPVHRVTGKRHLFANPVSIEKIDSLSEAESKELIEVLYKHAISEEFQYRHHWKKGDVIIWDNMATMHMALNDYGGQRRVMHRISVGV